jgi:hypothetical protein
MSKYRSNYADYILKDYSEKIFVYLPGSTVKSANYDKFRDTGYQRSIQNYLTVNAFVRPMVSNELVVKQLGLVAIGSVKIVIKNNDVALFKLASRVVIKGEDFYVYNDAVGKKMLMVELDDSYTEITLFKKEV